MSSDTDTDYIPPEPTLAPKRVVKSGYSLDPVSYGRKGGLTKAMKAAEKKLSEARDKVDELERELLVEKESDTRNQRLVDDLELDFRVAERNERNASADLRKLKLKLKQDSRSKLLADQRERLRVLREQEREQMMALQKLEDDSGDERAEEDDRAALKNFKKTKERAQQRMMTGGCRPADKRRRDDEEEGGGGGGGGDRRHRFDTPGGTGYASHEDYVNEKEAERDGRGGKHHRSHTLQVCCRDNVTDIEFNDNLSGQGFADSVLAATVGVLPPGLPFSIIPSKMTGEIMPATGDFIDFEDNFNALGLEAFINANPDDYLFYKWHRVGDFYVMLHDISEVCVVFKDESVMKPVSVELTAQEKMSCRLLAALKVNALVGDRQPTITIESDSDEEETDKTAVLEQKVELLSAQMAQVLGALEKAPPAITTPSPLRADPATPLHGTPWQSEQLVLLTSRLQEEKPDWVKIASELGRSQSAVKTKARELSSAVKSLPSVPVELVFTEQGGFAVETEFKQTQADHQEKVSVLALFCFALFVCFVLLWFASV